MNEDEERHALVCLAIGRLFRICSRPFQEGDLEQFEMCRKIIMGELDPLPRPWEYTSAAERAPRGQDGDWCTHLRHHHRDDM